MRALIPTFVVLDDDEACEDAEEGEGVEGGVHALAHALLLGRVGRLQNEGRLHEKEETEAHEEGMGRK